MPFRGKIVIDWKELLRIATRFKLNFKINQLRFPVFFTANLALIS